VVARYSKNEIQRWIEDIEQSTLDRCRIVERRVAASGPLSQQIETLPDRNERVFAALFTGDFEMLRRSQFQPNWVSCELLPV